ncbi:MAG: hypothetical protein RI956_1025 [Pseudomonadota bacterium]|jgi:methionyl-tRNA formyltransferase
MRIVFAGTPFFADFALMALLTADPSLNYDVVAVFTQPDRPAGRGMKILSSPVKQTAVQYGIPVYQPHSLKLDGQYSEDAYTAYTALNILKPDVIIVAAYGLILPQWTLNLPVAGCINIHASLLPRWRGAAPIQRAIEAGDSHSGVTLMQMALGLDTGDMYVKEAVQITPHTTGGQLHDALAKLGAGLLCQYLDAIVAGNLKPIAQSLNDVTYANKLTREHGVLDWNLPASTLVNQIRAFDPTPGCSFKHRNKYGDDHSYKVWAAHVSSDCLSKNVTYQLGDIVSLSEAGLDILCAAELNHQQYSVLRITEIQKPSGKRLPVSVCWQHLDLIF